VPGEELDISHPMLELDTARSIRSFIGRELPEMGGILTITDDTESGLTSNRDDFNSELDVSSSSSSSDEDISLHIRDEACQTGDDDGPDTSGLAGYYPIVRDRVPKRIDNGIVLSLDEEMSVWRTLLHSDDSYNDLGNDFVKYDVHPSANRSFELRDRRSLSETADNGGLTSVLISTKSVDNDREICGGLVGENPRCLFKSDSRLPASVVDTAASKKHWSFDDDREVCSGTAASEKLRSFDDDGEICRQWDSGMPIVGPHRLFKSESSLLTSATSEKHRPLSFQDVVTPPRPDLAEDGMGICSDSVPGEEVLVTGRSQVDVADDTESTTSIRRHLKPCRGSSPADQTSDTGTSQVDVADDTESTMSIRRHLKPCHGSSPADQTSDVGTSLSDIAVAIRSELLPGDGATVTADMDTLHQIAAATTTEGPKSPQPGLDNLRAKSGGGDAHPPGTMVCMDHEVCSLLADFVAHL